MQIDPAEHTGHRTYQLLTSVVMPRPVAWVTSLGPEGVVNLAPFSFFNAVSGHPPYVVLSVGLREDGTLKDTARNIQSSQQFVVNLVTEELLTAMNISAVDFPPDESELTAAGLASVPSVHVAVPRLAESPVSLECTLFKSERLGANTLYIGQVVMFHVADGLIDQRLRVHGFAPIGRLGAPSAYCRTSDRFELPRLSYTELQNRQDG
jgi:flavin reductase (DIM6/NTAB) family NADH-FMN oxidoreductase RutF